MSRRASHIFQKGAKWWARVKDGGKWISKPTPYAVGTEEDEQKAIRFAKELQRLLDERAGAVSPEPPDRPTVRTYAARFLAGRKGLRSQSDDQTRLEHHALPTLGKLYMDEVRPRHVRELVQALKAAGTLAPTTIRKVYGVVVTMFRTAVAEEVITATPCVLQRGVLPKAEDKDPEWRFGAVFTRAECERLLTDPEIPADRRMTYAIAVLTGMRHAEIASLRWRQFHPDLSPLGALDLPRTKSGVPRRVPVHPTLGAILAAWRLSGWQSLHGRAPTGADPIVPTRALGMLANHQSWYNLQRDLATLGLRKRRFHDFRRTFVSLAQEDGAAREILRVSTHGASKRDIMSTYSTFTWAAQCAEVAKLRLHAKAGEVVHLATGLATAAASCRARYKKTSLPAKVGSVLMAVPTGVEPEPSAATMHEDGRAQGEPDDVDGVDVAAQEEKEPTPGSNLATAIRRALRAGDNERALVLTAELQSLLAGTSAKKAG